MENNIFLPGKVLLGSPGILPAQDIIDKPKDKHKLTPYHLIASQIDWSFFTLAPVYALVKRQGKGLIDFDIVEQFRFDSGLDFDHFTYQYSENIYDAFFHSENAVLESMPKVVFPVFMEWCKAQVFKYTIDDPPESHWWRIAHGEYTITDPLSKAELATITVFIPTSDLFTVRVTLKNNKPMLAVLRS